jgi:UDP-N-acetyl-D-galactosamine dehydrogenase
MFKIGILGLGYVGLPLAIEFGKKYQVIGYDKKAKRINELKYNCDKNFDINEKEFLKSKKLNFTNNLNHLKSCNIFIVTVPTPVTKKNIPDLRYIRNACLDISQFLKKDDIVIFESTVYPGLTEEFCVPILQRKSGLVYNKDFFCGYSPERINPNDKIYNIKNIVKITSGSNDFIANKIDKLYKKIIKAGTYKAPSISVAEAAKVIENAQRDLNIAFINELALIFNKLNIDLNDVLKAASTKWNFLKFKPGLVGGHCIGVDPYHLSYKSKKSGYNPKIITAGRKINDDFVNFVAKKATLETRKRFKFQNLNFLVLGLSFKENCADYRNSKSINLINILRQKKFNVDCFDPLIDKKSFNKEFNIKINLNLKNKYYHCIILAVSHDYFVKVGESKLKLKLKKNGVFFDLKNVFLKNKKNLYI